MKNGIILNTAEKASEKEKLVTSDFLHSIPLDLDLSMDPLEFNEMQFKVIINKLFLILTSINKLYM